MVERPGLVEIGAERTTCIGRDALVYFARYGISSALASIMDQGIHYTTKTVFKNFTSNRRY